MIFDEIPFELKEHIFNYVTPNEWINTAKVSKEWLELTLGCIKKIGSCHVPTLNHLVQFINQQRNTNYTWVSLLAMMPKLEHLECFGNTAAFWRKISPVCPQLKILDFQPRNNANFDWNKLNIRFNNLTELISNGKHRRPAFLSKLFKLAPKLEKITLKGVQIKDEWEKIPKSVKHIFLEDINLDEEYPSYFTFGIFGHNVRFPLSLDNLCEDNSALETFSALRCEFSMDSASKFFNETLRLKKLELELTDYFEKASMIITNALRSCRALETVKVYGVEINESWRKLIPPNVKFMKFCDMKVQKNVRRDFSFDWLFQNYDTLQSLKLRCVDWTGLEYQKFYSTENLKKLYLDNYGPYFEPRQYEPIEPFSDICVRVMRPSHLVDLEICKLTIDEYWRQIFPPTIKRLKLIDVRLSEQAQLVFSPQFICENPSNIQCLKLVNFDGYLPAMDSHAFSGMHMLQELQLKDLFVPVECLQSILTYCSALTDLRLKAKTVGKFTHIPRNLVLPTLRKLEVNGSFAQHSLLLQHFPNVRTPDIAVVSSEQYFSDMHASNASGGNG